MIVIKKKDKEKKITKYIYVHKLKDFIQRMFNVSE